MKKQLQVIVALIFIALSMDAYSLGWERTTSNTGLAGVGLTCDELPLYTGPNKPAAGTTLSQVRITYDELILSNGNITLDKVCVRPTAAGSRMGVVFGYNPDTADNQLGNVIIRDSDIDGTLITNDGVYTSCGFRGAGSVYRTKIWGLGNGICYFGSSTVTSSVVEDNYVYGLRGGYYGSPSQPSHNESGTIRYFVGTSLIWRGNKLVSLTGFDSGALFIQTISGNIRNVLIDGNYFETAAWNLALEAAYGSTYSAMQATNNRFVIPSGGFGAAYITGGPGYDVWYENYIYNAGAIDGKGAAVGCPGGACASAVDTTAPSVPTGLAASTVSPTQINLSWAASTDNIGVYQYDIRRCSGSGCTPSTVIASPTTNSYNNTGLTANTLYRYDVRARDLAGNSSAYSSVAQAQTDPPDTTAPTTPGTPSVTATGNNTATLTWTASTDNLSVANYIVYRCSGTGCTPSTQVATPTSNSYSDSGLTKNTLYRYAVRAVDASSNQSALSGIGQATTQNNTYDTPTIDPSTPAAIKSNAGALTTASFNPPAGSVLYVMLMTQNQTSSPTVASSGLTFTSRGNYGTTGNDTYVRLWTAPVASSGARTVTVTQVGSGNYALMKVLVVTGANATTPVANVSGSVSNTGAISTTYTSTSDNSLGWALYADWTQGAIPTPGTGVSIYDSYTVAGEDTYAILKRTAVTPTAGTSVTLSTTAPTSGRQTAWLVFEMLPSSGSGGGGTPTQPPAPLANGKVWQLNFAEEFSGTTLDTSKLTPCFDWNYGSCTESFNQGKERYMPSQVQVSGGTAKLVAEPLSPPYASGGCYNGSCTYKAGFVGTSRPLANDGSDYLYKFTYGYVESKLKFPGTAGFFTAFWMLPASTSFTYPTEIDIAEILGGYPNTVFMNYHYNNRSSNYTPNNGTGNNGACTVKDYSADWVTLGLDWQPTYIAWYIDGVKCGQFNGNTSTIESGPMQIMLHMMVDNQWERDWGSVLANQTLSATLEVDYLRVWQQVDNPVSDTTAPTVSISAPTNGANVQGASVAVTATASDNVGVVGVQFKLDGSNLGSEDTSAPYAATLDSMVLSDGPHTLTAVARDAAGNSTTSSSVSITVDNNAPSAPTGLGVTAASGTQLNLTWTASTDTVGVSSYDVRRCSGAGCTPSTIIASPTTNSFSNTGLSNLTLYRYDVRAKDAIGNASAYSSVAQATTLDSTAPTAPANVTATAVSSSQINLAWDASTDNAAVASYSVERCAGSGCSNYLEISTPATTSLNNTGLQPSTIYRYRVRAKDTSNNFSTYSATAQATTQAVAPTDTTPPVITITGPAAVLAIGTTSAAITATTDEAATCKIATAANIPFASKSAMGTTGTTSHSQTVNISDGKVIHRWIACQDAAGNVSADSQVSFSVTTAKRKRGRM